MKFKQWMEDLGYSRTPPNLPRTQDGRIGNELKTDAGQLAKTKAGETGTDKFRTGLKNVTELPVPRQDSAHGLGELGMRNISKATFGGDRLGAGGAPTLVNGIPVANTEGQFKNK